MRFAEQSKVELVDFSTHTRLYGSFNIQPTRCDKTKVQKNGATDLSQIQ